MLNKCIVIVGPTGVGKTKLSIELAKKLNAEVINADSTQVYKGLDIATAKVTKKDTEGIVHHLIDIKDINEDYTVFDYQKDAEEIIKDINSRGKRVIIVGGTGLYLKALLYGYNFNEEEKVMTFDDLTNDELYNKLKEVDPNTEVHKNNRKRVERAYQYYLETNKQYSEKEKQNNMKIDSIIIGLTTDRKLLYDNINKRVDMMVSNGLLDEAKKIYETNIRTKAVMTPIGYKELFPYFDGIKTLEECFDLIKQNSRRYAKKQFTWFNNQMDVKWYNVNFNKFDLTVEEILKDIKKAQ